MNLILTVALAMFAAIEAYSTFLQGMIQDKKNLIDDARNELEKAYGPIYSLLNKTVEKDEVFIKLNVDEKLKLDEILSTYPFMFPPEIYDYWQNKIRSLESKMSAEIPPESFFSGSGHLNYRFSHEYHIPLEFVNIFNTEYKKKSRTLMSFLINWQISQKHDS